MKRLYFDVETTGLDPQKQDIIQFACMVEIDGEIKEAMDITMQPFDYDAISPEALLVHGRSVEDLKTYQTPQQAYAEIVKLFGKYINKYDKSDKFQPAAYNAHFDMDFLKAFFAKNGNVYFGSYMTWRTIDPLQLLYFLDGMGEISLPDYKLETACKHFGIKIDAHDALSDVTATIELISLLTNSLVVKFP